MKYYHLIGILYLVGLFFFFADNFNVNIFADIDPDNVSNFPSFFWLLFVILLANTWLYVIRIWKTWFTPSVIYASTIWIVWGLFCILLWDITSLSDYFSLFRSSSFAYFFQNPIVLKNIALLIAVPFGLIIFYVSLLYRNDSISYPKLWRVFVILTCILSIIDYNYFIRDFDTPDIAIFHWWVFGRAGIALILKNAIRWGYFLLIASHVITGNATWHKSK